MGQGYYTFTRITDYGPYVTKLILPLPQPVTAGSVSPKKFSVYVERMDEKGEILLLPKSWMARDDREPSRGYIPLKDAYLSDGKGNKLPKGDHLTLETDYGPLAPLTSGISAPHGLNIMIKTRYTITQTGTLKGKNGPVTGLVYDYPLGAFCPDTENFLHGTSSYREPINYGYFVPQKKASGSRPLIIWLHGAGEGGTDPTVAYAGNKVVNLASEEIQEKFGGAYVLVPQTKTFWMNDGTGTYGRTGTSIYGKALKACIDEFLDKNPAIDRNRIYLGGDSNGGFMTMRMILDYPDFFAAAFPVCEALYDETIPEKKLKAVKDMGIWFTHAKNDPVVKPEETVVPTYKRLIKLGAKNVHFTFWDNIKDIHEGFTDKNGEPFEYIGHFAWVPLLNDDCRLDFDGKPVKWKGKEVSLFTWLSKQSKG